nr:serine protease easter-like [Leptinotarsa decemlineata]
MCLFKVLGVSVLFILCDGQDWVVDDYGCRTPDGGVGDCTPINQCKSLVNCLLNATKPISQKVKEKLNAYLCSYKLGLIWVCCPEEPIVDIDEPTIITTTPAQNENPPDVTQHKNLKLLPDECGLIYSSNKIRNGKNAFLNEFPWMALLSYKTSRGPEFMCGGTVINEKYILTAAHCIVNMTYPLLGARVGEYDILTKVDCVEDPKGTKKCIGPVQNIAIEEIIPHPKYQREVIQNDIGLLRLSGINLQTDNVKPVCLPVDEELANAQFKFATVTGWGITDPKTGETSNILQKVDLDIVTQKNCSNAYKDESNVQITNKLICAGGRENKDSCKGDSGGPLQVAAYANGAIRYIQQGVVSFGHSECGKEGYPAVFTKVSFYLDWILDSIRP